jgi:hypothetical protein
MLDYINSYIKTMIATEATQYANHWRVLNQEIERFDPRDFEPSVRTELLQVKAEILDKGVQPGRNREVNNKLLEQLLRILDGYLGEGSHGISRSFAYIADPELRFIIERDYAELTLKLFPSNAWKSTVIMAGSILEAILFDRLADAKWNARAVASPKALDRAGRPIPMADWRLENLIDIAVDITMLPKDPANTIHQVLRDYRNFVHPKKEVRAAHACTDAEAMLAVGALNSVCNYIEKNP